eukprot:TRINITY_DN10440_c0_g2_i5.p1 TRINITY_DN10440_c0_g2~~TRINITY_DN10440_c0_g2_i5.p1  ORF type:complete len:726 (+),score=140.60 TRINITY_DN10440_c0_g2_i5:20-2197(+)
MASSDVVKPLHIISWNVAGWLPTLKLIRRWHGSLENYLSLLQVDILCIQEVKIQRQKLEQDPQQCGAFIDGYDTFYSCCELPGQLQGLNGVATFVRKGLTSSADARPFREPSLDIEGRAIVTKHAQLAVINVYVPNESSGCSRLPYKAKFLAALSKLMQQLKSQGYNIILLGDLNIARRAQDVHWERRLLHVEDFLAQDWSACLAQWPAVTGTSSLRDRITVLQEHTRKFAQACTLPCSHCGGDGCDCVTCAASENGCTVCTAKLPTATAPVLHRHASFLSWLRMCIETLVEVQSILKSQWPTMAHAIEHRTTAPIEVSFKGTAKQTKHRLLLKDKTGKVVPIGLPHSSPAAALRHLNMEPTSVVDPAGEGVHVVHYGGELHVNQIIELLNKVCKVELSPLQQRCLAAIGQRITCPGNGAWIDRLLDETDEVQTAFGTVDAASDRDSDGLGDDRARADGSQEEKVQLVDTFTAVHPSAQARFTCWDQYKNKRYENIGARIDYILIDKQLEAVLSTACPADACQLDQTTCPPCLSTTAVEHDKLGSTPAITSSVKHRAVYSEAAALAATTAQGRAPASCRWQPAPFDGSGISEGSQKDYMYQFQTPHTGMLYTPPSYSDHIGVSALLKVQIGPVTLLADAATRQTRPYASQARISDFVKRAQKTQSSEASDRNAALFSAFRAKQASNGKKPVVKAKKKARPSAKRASARSEQKASKTPKLTAFLRK